MPSTLPGALDCIRHPEPCQVMCTMLDAIHCTMQFGLFQALYTESGSPLCAKHCARRCHSDCLRQGSCARHWARRCILYWALLTVTGAVFCVLFQALHTVSGGHFDKGHQLLLAYACVRGQSASAVYMIEHRRGQSLWSSQDRSLWRNCVGQQSASNA